MSDRKQKRLDYALLRFTNAACVIADEHRPGKSEDVRIRRVDFDDLVAALADYRTALRESES